MKPSIGLTMRVTYDSYGVRCDILDQRWIAFLRSIDARPVLLSSSLPDVREALRDLDVGGVVLTGGNDLVKYGGDAPDRDRMEQQILEVALEGTMPVIGVCRGLQIIQDFFGGNLEKVRGHAGCQHFLTGLGNRSVVNSYHTFGFREAPEELIVTSRSEDGVVESVRHKSLPIYGIMWHPERNTPFEVEDLMFFRKIFWGEM